MRLRNRILSSLGGLFAVALTAGAITLSHENDCPPVAAPPTGETMRSVTQRCYGNPEVLRVERVAKPAPGEHELLIKVRAASVNPFEWHMTTGKPYLLRLFRGIGAPKGFRLGNDFSGTVEAVGAKVTRFKIGDEVFGGTRGAFAEYTVAPEDGEIALKPEGVSHEQAAALPIAGVTALQALRDQGHLAAGQHVLINGASGGVGSYAIQIAKSMGATVTAVCSTRNVELVRSLGADHVIDYTKQDFTEVPAQYDVVVDNVGNHGFLAIRKVVKPTGVIVTVSGPKENPWTGPLTRKLQGKILAPFIDQKLVSFLADVDVPDLELLVGMMRDGKLRTAVDRTYPLEETVAALEYIGSRRAQGKVLVMP